MNANKIVVIIVGVALMAAVLLLWPGTSQPATAQYTESDMGQLLTTLWERVLAEQSTASMSSFVFTIGFDTSVAGIGNSVTFGQGLESLQLREAGVDYFCIARQFSRTTNVDCIPYTNISKISYAER